MTDPILDRAAIDDVLNRYCVALDARDVPALRACFHADAALQYDGLMDGDPDAFVTFLDGDTGLRGLERTMHVLGTRVIDVDGDDAEAVSYCVAEHLGPDDHPWCRGQVTAWCRYTDRLERRDGTWRIARRHAAVQWTRHATTDTIRRPRPAPADPR